MEKMTVNLGTGEKEPIINCEISYDGTKNLTYRPVEISLVPEVNKESIQKECNSKNIITVTSSGEIYTPKGTDIELSAKEIRALFTMGLSYCIGNSTTIKGDLTSIQDYINPSIETLLKEDGHNPQALYHIRKKDLPEEIIKQIPEIYNDTESIISKLLVEPPQATIICVEKDDTKNELYAEWHDKHSGYTSKKVAEGEEVSKYFKEIRAKTAINLYQFDELTIQ